MPTPSTDLADLYSRLPVLALCCAIAAVCALDRVVLSVAILPMSQQYDFSDTTKGLVAAAFSLGYCIGLLPCGIAASTLSSPRTVLGVGLVTWSAAQAATPAAAALGTGPLLATRALMGVGEAAAIPSLQVIAANFVPPDFRSKFWGLLTSSLSFGTILAYTLSPNLMESFGWSSVFEIYGAVGGVLALAWALIGADFPSVQTEAEAEAKVYTEPELRTEPGENTELEMVQTNSGVTAKEEAAGLDELPWGAMLTSRPVWALTVAHAASNFFLYFALSWLPTYFNYQFGLDTAAASSASLLPFAAGAIASLLAGTACDALVAQGVDLTNARKLMQSIAFLGPALSMTTLALLGSGSTPPILGLDALTLDRDEAEALFIAAIACQAVSAAGFGCASQDISARFASLLYGATSVFAVIAGAGGQYYTGQLLESNGRDFSPMFALTAAVEIAGLLVFLKWWKSDRAFE